MSGLDDLRRDRPLPLPSAIAQQPAIAIDVFVVGKFKHDSPGADDKKRLEASLTQTHQVMEITQELIVELGRALGRVSRRSSRAGR